MATGVLTPAIVALLCYLPGALAFRAPILDRARRADLRPEERLYWAVVVSVAWSLLVTLALAVAEVYTLGRTLAVNGLACAAIALFWRGRLRYSAAPARVNWTTLLPLALIVLGAVRFFPAAEYVIGGKDPGTYMNEGFQIAKRGSVIIREDTVSQLPRSLRDLFFNWHGPDAAYFDNRFMGFFLRDPAAGDTVGQFPHLYPASIALAFDTGGLQAALSVTGLWAMLGVVSVYFLGARLLGSVAAAAAAALLALNVLQVWWARYPNAEIAMQPLLFAALLAFARAHQDSDRFFAPIAGLLLGSLAFLRLEAGIALAAVAAAIGLVWIVQRRGPRLSFVLTTAAMSLVGAWYFSEVLAAYSAQPILFARRISPMFIAAAVGATIAAAIGILLLRRRVGERAASAVPAAIAAAVIVLASYALFFRAPGGKLTDYDAYGLRIFTESYFLWPVVVAALIGFAIVVRRDFWRDPAFIAMFVVFAVLFCYKLRIVPTHFWMSRRLVPIVLPGVLLFAAAAALTPRFRSAVVERGVRIAGAVFLALVGWQYALHAAPVAAHVEYRGLVPYIDALASRFSDRDLIIVEGRDAGSDTHVLAPPLAYLHDRHTLVLESPIPNKQVLEAFLAFALQRYERVFFVGGGGTDLLSRRIQAHPVADARVRVPEYESTHWSEYPDEVRGKDFEYSIYELQLGAAAEAPFSLDLGYQDDLNVVRFHAKETNDGRSIRWTGAQSFVAVPGLTGAERTLSVVMHNGGRPAKAGAARVEVLFDGEPVGVVEVRGRFETFTLPLPEDAVRRAAGRDAPAQIAFRTATWIPRDVLGGNDGRALGVMIDRLDVR